MDFAPKFDSPRIETMGFSVNMWSNLELRRSSGAQLLSEWRKGLQALRQEAASTCQAKAKYRHWRHDIESPAPFCTTAVAPGSRIDRTDRGQVAVHSDFHAEATTLAVNLRFLLVSSSCFTGMPPIF